jgi:hypothetical protein
MDCILNQGYHPWKLFKFVSEIEIITYNVLSLLLESDLFSLGNFSLMYSDINNIVMQICSTFLFS